MTRGGRRFLMEVLFKVIKYKKLFLSFKHVFLATYRESISLKPSEFLIIKKNIYFKKSC